jgi:hypothetical protein
MMESKRFNNVHATRKGLLCTFLEEGTYPKPYKDVNKFTDVQ